jgi:hypothetical protein
LVATTEEVREAPSTKVGAIDDKYGVLPLGQGTLALRKIVKDPVARHNAIKSNGFARSAAGLAGTT